MSNYNTAYDDAFRTMLVECKTLIFPVVNESFLEEYTGMEEIVLNENEVFLRQQDGEEEKRITDASFAVISADGESSRYHLECQSTPDSSMLVRIYEYDSQIALKNSAWNS